MVTKLQNSNCDNSKNQVVTTQKQNFDKIQLKLSQNSKTKIVTKLINLNSNKTEIKAFFFGQKKSKS